MTHLFLIRHGQTDWNLQGRWPGQADPPLNATGRAQAEHTARELCEFKFDALYSSDLQRAYETAEIIGDTLGLFVVREPRLREIHLGAWQGMFSQYIKTNYPAAFREWHESPLTTLPPGGETITTLSVRVISAIEEIIERHPNKTVAIVSHELPIAIVRCCAAGSPLTKLRDWIPANGEWVEVTTSRILLGTS